jgi:uncharacterized repeat protein (TIGR03803 family)
MSHRARASVQEFPSSKSHNCNFPFALLAAAMFAFLLLTLVADQPACAQSFKVLHTFDGTDGGFPLVGLTMDRAGNLYGTTSQGVNGFGTVFKLTRNHSGWIFTTLYVFKGGTDGATPEGRVAFGPDGVLYGTMFYGGDPQCDTFGGGCGTVFKLQPPVTPCTSPLCPWIETVLIRFNGIQAYFPLGDITFDAQGNIYGSCGPGIYELAHSNGAWTFSLLSPFSAIDGVIFDSSGNLYGTSVLNSQYIIFQLTPSRFGWTDHVLYTLNPSTDGYFPGGLLFDRAGNLYGANSNGGPNGGGTVFKLAPSSGSWVYSVLYALSGPGTGGPMSGTLARDSAGTLYGSVFTEGTHNQGAVFKLTPSNGTWTYTPLYDFTGRSDGCYAVNGPVLDANENLYGTAEGCGAGNPGNGTVWEITP